jgi:hypothetical protein
MKIQVWGVGSITYFSEFSATMPPVKANAVKCFVCPRWSCERNVFLKSTGDIAKDFSCFGKSYFLFKKMVCYGKTYMAVTAKCINRGKDFTHTYDSTAGLQLVHFDNQSCHLYEQQRFEYKALHRTGR